MGNPAGGQHIFGADRLEDLYPPMGAPPAPIAPAPMPAPVIPPAPTPTTTPGSTTNPGGLISGIIGGGNTGTNAPVSGSSVPVPGNNAPGGYQGGVSAPTAPNTGVMIGPNQGFRDPNGPVSGIIRGAPVAPAPGTNPMMSETEWKDKFRQDAAQRAKSPGGGIISDIVAAPAETPAAPVAAPAAPVAAPAPKKKAAVEADPYERWKQMGRPGGSFENWKKGQK